VDVASHRFWKFAHPDALDTTSAGRGLGPREVIDEYYVYVDVCLEYLERIGPDTTLVVLRITASSRCCSRKTDHLGHHRWRSHRPFGRGVRPGRTIRRRLLDVLPTLLYLLDLPLARTSRKGPETPSTRISCAPPAEFLDSYGTPAHPGGRPDRSSIGTSWKGCDPSLHQLAGRKRQPKTVGDLREGEALLVREHVAAPSKLFRRSSARKKATRPMKNRSPLPVRDRIVSLPRTGRVGRVHEADAAVR